MVAEPSWSGIRKPRASIYLWSRIAGVYVEPPLHNRNALFSASVAYRINPSPLVPFRYVLHEILFLRSIFADFIIVSLNGIRSSEI